jgi:cation transport regulator ChaC
MQSSLVRLDLRVVAAIVAKIKLEATDLVATGYEFSVRAIWRPLATYLRQREQPYSFHTHNRGAKVKREIEL